MKNHLLRSCFLFTGLALATPVFAAVDHDAGYIDLGKFTAAPGGQFVEINLKPAMLKFAATIVSFKEPEVAELLHNLKLVRVNVVGLDDSNRRETVAQVAAIRADLEKQGWEKIITVREAAGENGDDVAIFMKPNGEDSIAGLVVTVIEKGGQVVFVNVVGNIRADQIAQLGEKFDIQPLRKIKVAAES
jgi:hypothetical protein